MKRDRSSRRHWLRAAVVAGAIGLSAGSSHAQSKKCGLELILAVDVSGSVNRKEYRLQIEGLAKALRAEDVVRLMVDAGRKGLHITAVQWSGQPHQKQIVPWTKITDKRSVLSLADRVVAAERAFVNFSTAIGEALAFSRELFGLSGVTCRRRVIDVSGDGRNNEGADPALLRDHLVGEGIAINGLVILGGDKKLGDYFRQNVIGGNGAFVLSVATFEDYPKAIKQKLLREIAPKITLDPTVTLAQEQHSQRIAD